MPGPMRVGVMLRFRDIIKPVAPARLTHALLRLHHYITKGGEGFIAIGADHHRYRMLAAGKEGLQHRLRQHRVSGNRRWPGIQRRGERPEGLRGDRPQFLSAGLR